jgi:alginate O-acetyltransferase complex protein AlgI
VPFNSLSFLALFALTVAVYYAAPHRWRWTILLAASIYFYSAFEVRYLALLAYATVVAYGVGLAMAGRAGTRAGRVVLTVGVVAEVAVLALFKYLNFFSASAEPALREVGLAVTLPRLDIVLPVGLSFYTFSCISYIVDSYRGTISPERHFGRLALYVAFFPKLLAGPIERAGPFLAQVLAPVRWDYERVAAGLWLVLWGLVKKVIIADRLAEFVDPAFRLIDTQSPVTLLVAVYLYAFQIYCDFSGYSDIAIGAALVLGITLMENFRRPYLSKSVAEFWGQRWHISLSRWFRDYVYIPMGGSRVSAWRWYLNQIVVFVISGLWHGANWTFVIWGAYNGLLQVLHFLLARPRNWIRSTLRLPTWLADTISIVLTFHLILVGWVFFRAASYGDAIKVFARVYNAAPQLWTLALNYNWSAELQLSLGLIAALLLIEALDERRPLWSRLERAPTMLRWGVCHGLLAGLLVIGRWGQSQFVYMQF